MFYVYVLRLSDNSYYKGLSNDLNRRLEEHTNRKNKYTRNYLPCQLVHVELCETRLEARKIEKFLKSGYGREIIKEIDGNL